VSVIRQLYQLQTIELEIESREQALTQAMSRLGESQEVAEVRARLAEERLHLSTLNKKQGSLEEEIEDIAAKLEAAQESLYSGRIKNPKELISLQHEVESLKDKRNQVEEKALGIMEQVEQTQANLASLEIKLKEAEGRWQLEQQKIGAEVEQLKTMLSQLNSERQLALAAISPEVADLYQRLRKQKGTAVARVERGTCCGCRISLSTAELQRARGDRLVMCSYCGRILFLD
jgi:predicted  nucleic acid-binding Zn-ribbon protein